jgi:hypothetical protein
VARPGEKRRKGVRGEKEEKEEKGSGTFYGEKRGQEPFMAALP